MKKLALCFLAVSLGLQAAALCAQTPDPEGARPAPRFKLKLSEEHNGAYLPTYHVLSLIVTNISNEVFLEPGCSEFRGLYLISVEFNGAPLAEKDPVARRRNDAVEVQNCYHELGINEIKPGVSFQRLLELSQTYDMSRPGNYEVTVTRETDPEHPEKSVTVRSNTITVVVKPEDLQPK